MSDQNNQIPSDGFNTAPQMPEAAPQATPPVPPAAPVPPTFTPPAHRSSGALIPGIVLIGLGVIFMLQNTTNFRLHNWWALFILIPAFSALAAAYRMYKENNRLNTAARGSLISGLILSLVAAVFLFGLSWSILWPLVLVLVGLGILLGNLR